LVFEAAAELNKKELEIALFNRFAVFTTLLGAVVLSSTTNLQAHKSEVKNIVLVHGAWTDGSGWRGVYDNLVRDGFNVTIVQESDNFKAAASTPAWRSKPSWMLVAAKDRTINPDLEQWYVKRAHSHTVEVAGSGHSVYVSHPKEVVKLKLEAVWVQPPCRDSTVNRTSESHHKWSNQIAARERRLHTLPSRKY